MFIKTVLIFCLSLLVTFLNAQVKGPERIIGDYTGDTKKEYAHGNGKAVGIDTYEGEFKKGVPKGDGKYIFGDNYEIDGEIYSAGDMYIGEFKDGKFDGKGKVIFAGEEKDSIIGYWAKGKYIGRTKEGYEILEKDNIVRISCLYQGYSRNNITITGLEDIIELGQTNIEFNSGSTFNNIPAKYTNLSSDKFPFIIHIKGSVPTTGAKAELKMLLERPGSYEITIVTN